MRPTVPLIAEYLKRFYNSTLPASRKAPTGGTSSNGDDAEGSSAEGSASDCDGEEGDDAEAGGESEEVEDDMVVDAVPGGDLGVIPRTVPSESSSSVIVTPPPKGFLVAKKRGKHYFVKDRTYGYRCLNCDCASQDLAVLKGIQCEPPEGSEARVEATTDAELELEKLRDLEAEGYQLQELLKFEQQQLEEMMLQHEIYELERQLAQEEHELHEAKIRSLEDAAREASKRSLDAVFEPAAEKNAGHVDAAASARDAGHMDVAAAEARDAGHMDAAAAEARDAGHMDGGATEARDAGHMDRGATEARDAGHVDRGATEARDAKRPRIEQSNTVRVSAVAGPDCFDTVPYDMEDVGLQNEGSGEGHCLTSEVSGVSPTRDEDDDDDAESVEADATELEEDKALEEEEEEEAKPAASKEPKTAKASKDDAKPKAKAGCKNKASKPNSSKPGAAQADAKQLAKEAKSRKSVAYHKAFKEAKDQGKSEEECRAAAKQVLLLRWMTTLAFEEKYEFFELFSGEGKVTQLWHAEGLSTASFDKLYGDPMNFLQNQGFTIACWVVLNECPDACNLVGPDCSSWGLPARATSMRSKINPFGRMGLTWVSSNNCLVSRLVLFLLLVMARQCTWIIEQPHQSLLKTHPRWDWMCNQVVRVFEQRFWMMLHGAPSPKPTVVLSPMPTIAQLDRGPLTKAEKLKRNRLTTVRTIPEIYSIDNGQ
ncbi:unnamed protein product [Symbiodinium necroappetens]|uniref:Uncharacterized protein n=1 Tax=Symbiodinium necroappetens TaxID=1628268 RepID=A0A812VQH5_9DINO|nr:unnamed protein product [Symbiodinium necroappetens]